MYIVYGRGPFQRKVSKITMCVVICQKLDIEAEYAIEKRNSGNFYLQSLKKRFFEDTFTKSINTK